VQDPLQLPVAGRIMGCIDGLVVLTEELTTLPFRQALEDDLRVIRVLRLDRLGGHEPRLRPDGLPRRTTGSPGQNGW